MNIDLSAPLWAIDHVAASLFVSIDTAREHTYSHSFPKAKAGFSRNLWLREEGLTWFANLPSVDRSQSDRRNHGSAVRPAPAAPGAVNKPANAPKPHMPRKKPGALA